jgi:hypothetical protein
VTVSRTGICGPSPLPRYVFVMFQLLILWESTGARGTVARKPQSVSNTTRDEARVHFWMDTPPTRATIQRRRDAPIPSHLAATPGSTSSAGVFLKGGSQRAVDAGASRCGAKGRARWARGVNYFTGSPPGAWISMLKLEVSAWRGR